ncbi:MAG: hypothetical protein WKG00_27205 [Polyangiaceae bacterium]
MSKQAVTMVIASMLGACSPAVPSNAEVAAQLRASEASQQGGRYFHWLISGLLPARCGTCAEASQKCASLLKIAQAGWAEARCADGRTVLELTKLGMDRVAGAERSDEGGTITHRVHAATWELIGVGAVTLTAPGKARARYRYRWVVTEGARSLAAIGALGRDAGAEREDECDLVQDGDAWRLLPAADDRH